MNKPEKQSEFDVLPSNYDNYTINFIQNIVK